MLIDLDNDVAEKTNVAIQHPEVVHSLLQVAAQARTELGDWGSVGTHSHDFNGFPPTDINRRPVLQWKKQ